ncbi:MAG: hypothetical protein JWO74_5038 [Solirubrobacterales bacterium]|nr:hypothetical protein [Solirubrobacterales bacterium]
MPRLGPLASRSLSAWGRLVAASAFVLAGLGVVVGAWWATSSEDRVTSYVVSGSLNGVLLDLGDADADIMGGGEGRPVRVQYTDSFAFGHAPIVRRDVGGGVLSIRARCPKIVLGICSSRYRVTVPDNVPVTVRTNAGDVHFNDVRGSARIDTRDGDISVAGFCGFSLLAQSQTGDVQATAACAAERMVLRSRTGDVRALVPRGRYRIDASSDRGTRRLSGITSVDDAPFQIQALSSTGDVVVEAVP